ncbi:glucosyltransferase [Staphylococcus piscifermentans]|uniref:Uncharacterized protein n=1 Tax=Staphylococcus piscifermentans TaxID=70258 RepID=A0A239TN00_9STAP|nr:DUF6056 family protein [Staphylococcus piscifermentans]RTX86222.1 hypothetical protein CD139_02135 [Staphylococcus piscifermentans]GEP85227.1 hypothetical protein SPI02_18120 [Staphylococcus piscifermentans]SNU98194.1 glucosyltransferase [Staphylococcus piscifermentans]
MKIFKSLFPNFSVQKVGLYIVILFFAILSALIPLSLDDYAWKSDVGIERMHQWFHDYNGRYLSNLLEIAAVRTPIVQVVTMTFFSSLLIVMLRQLTFRNSRSISYILILLVVMMLPIPLFAETFGWVAGYVNYVTSAVLMLYILKIYFEQYDRNSANVIQLIWYFLVGVIASLLVEHVTLYLIVIAFGAVIFYFYKFKKLKMVYFVFLIAHCVGAVMMFTNSAYRQVTAGKDHYRSVEQHTSMLGNITHLYLYNITPYFFTTNTLLLALLLMIVCIVTYMHRGQTLPVNIVFISILFIGLLFTMINRTNLTRMIVNETTIVIAGILFLCLIVIFPIFIWKNLQWSHLSQRIFFYYTSAIFLTLPFFVITPYSARCDFASQIFIILILLEMTKYILQNLHLKWPSKWSKNLAIIVMLALTLSYLAPISVNKYIDYSRSEKLLHMHHFPKEITIQRVPFEEFHKIVNFPNNSWMVSAYKEVHKVPRNVEVKIKP